MWRPNSCRGDCGRSLKASETWPVCGSGSHGAEQLDVGREAGSGEQHPVRFARFRFGQVEGPGIGAGQRRDVELQRPDLRVLRAGRLDQRVPIALSESGQATLPSAASG